MNARLSLPLIAALVALMLTALVAPAARASSDPAASGDALATLRAAEEAYDDGMQLLRSDPAEARRRC